LLDNENLDFYVAFLPLSYYLDLHTDRESPIHMSYEGTQAQLILGKSKLKPFWSSNYVEFEKFFFLGRNSVEWLVKLDERTGHRVRVEVKPRPDIERFDVTCETVPRMRMVAPELAFCLDPPFPK